MRVDEVLPLREQALYAASGGVPFLPGVEEFVRAINKAGVRMALATSSPTRLLQAKSARKEGFFAMFEGVVWGMMSSAASRARGSSEGRRGSRRAFVLLGRTRP
jgi:phosphoglycolate phosphatase-like HAD superfamily hydrolase